MIIESFSIANVVVVTMKQMTLLSKADGIAIRSRWHCYQKQMDGIDIIMMKTMHFIYILQLYHAYNPVNYSDLCTLCIQKNICVSTRSVFVLV